MEKHPCVKKGFSDTGIILLVVAVLLVVGVAWISNYWKEYDDRRINNHQPIGINEMVYGGLVRIRIKNHPQTGSMVNQQHFYYFKGINENQLRIEYIHSDSKGDQHKEDLVLPVSQGKAYLEIPPLPELVDINSQAKMLTLTVVAGKEEILATQD